MPCTIFFSCGPKRTRDVFRSRRCHSSRFRTDSTGSPPAIRQASFRVVAQQFDFDERTAVVPDQQLPKMVHWIEMPAATHPVLMPFQIIGIFGTHLFAFAQCAHTKTHPPQDLRKCQFPFLDEFPFPHMIGVAGAECSEAIAGRDGPLEYHEVALQVRSELA